MSADASADPAPNLNLTPEEKRVYGQLFRQADTDNVGVVTGEIAVKFFEKTKLDSRILGEIWQIADRENRGFLTPVGFGIVLRLIGHAQGGREPTTELAFQPGQLPQFDGINIGGGIAPPPPPAALQAQGTGGPVRIPPLTPEKVAQYAGLFERQSLQNGSMLPGDQAKNIFEKSGLPNEALGRIWQLADTEQRGALVLTEFVIAMHLLTSMKSGALRSLPTILPAALYEAATKRPSAARQSPNPTGTISAIPRQLSGSAQVRTNSPLGRPPMSPQGTGMSTQVTGAGSDWLVTPVDKARFDNFYADLDKTNKGFITGEEAVPFLSQSGLTEDALAQIWDLADINSEGRLTRDTFAVAMYLIRQHRINKDAPLPTSIPANLVPPSLRKQYHPTTAGASPFDAPVPAQAPPQPQPPKPTSALADLFDLDTTPVPALAQQPMSTGGSVAQDPFAGGPASPPRGSPAVNTFKPFIPSSSFGKTLTSNDTGASATGSASRSASDDLLGGDHDESNNKLADETMELANLSNQVSSLSKQMQEVQGQRSTTQNEISQASQQKKNFEDRLAQLRSLYEKEAADVSSLKEQLKAVREETRKLTGEMVSIDGTYQDLQKQHHELKTALQADQQEHASLKQRLSAVNAEIAQLKPQIEKLKSDARQQKGLVAINKKQLSTTEGERDKHKAEVEDLTKSNEEMSRSIGSTGSPTSAAAQVVSPALSTASGNNPFFRRTGSTDIMGAFASPQAKTYNDKSFDDIFGTVGTGSTTGTPPPPTSFKQQHTGNSSTSVGSGSFATPTGSTPTVSRQATLTSEPPAPPESKQLNSSFLPFGDASESLSSSRQVSPPASRADNEPSTLFAAEPAFPPAATDSVQSSSPKPEDLARSDSIPGAFPETPAAGPSMAGNRDSDPFGNMKDTRNAKEDFDSAFASFGTSSSSSSSSKPQEQPAKDFHSEFPPISELEQDDDSDSESEGNGFDDDFAPAGAPLTSKADPPKTEPPAATSPAITKAEPAGETGGSSLHAADLSAFPEPPKSPSFPPDPKDDDPFAATPTQATHPATAAAPAAAKGAFDELDDEFEGLEDAKEGSTEDEFANISRSNLSDFNPVFDSSPPPSQPKSEANHASNAFGNDSSYDFGNVSQASTATAANGTAPITGAAVSEASAAGKSNAADGHDWDAIFAGLDTPADANAASATESPKPTTSTLAPPDRPSTLGRALTEEGNHDDPIVKDLTAMGYSRKDAIIALEKYDYNLERAANFLASQS